MQFVNGTPFSAKMQCGSTGDREMICIIACKVTYVLEEGCLIPAPPEESWPVFDNPFVFQAVPLAIDLDFRRNGADVVVFGKARAPQASPCRSMRAGIHSGSLRYEVDVHGDRWWLRSGRGLVASEAQPFIEMPITNDRAFGGASTANGLPSAYSANPTGRGYYENEQEAEGNPLPNLERPEAPIRRWDERPRPAFFYKLAPDLLPEELQTRSPEQLTTRLAVEGFNGAIRELVVEPSQLGESIRLSGFSPTGDSLFPTPHRAGPTAHAFIGSARGRFPSAISSIVLLADEQVLVVTYLCLFRYLMSPMEKRGVELRWNQDPRVRPVSGRNS
ncbi:MAG: DUF2169 domain-containing protein [Acidobacteriia bacterium]|nr:DUF2169 domain-containing protein [Terriglobia bacterium]